MLYLAQVDELQGSFTVFITPYLPLITVAIGGIIVGVFSVYNRKRGAIETRAPDVNEIWVQQEAQSRLLDEERKGRRRLESMLGQLWSTFVGYVNRVQSGGSMQLTTHEMDIITESKDFDATVPSKPNAPE